MNSVDDDTDTLCVIVYYDDIHEMNLEVSPRSAEGINQVLIRHLTQGLEDLAAKASEQNKAILEDTIKVTPFDSSPWGTSDTFRRGTMRIAASVIDKDLWGSEKSPLSDSNA